MVFYVIRKSIFKCDAKILHFFTLPRRNVLARRNAHTHLACRHFSLPHKLKICGDPADMEKLCVD